MTKVYFIRHAEPNYDNHDDTLRELSSKGLMDRELVTNFLWDKDIGVVLSSPYKRAIDTVSDFAEKKELDIIVIENFKERRVDSGWIEDFDSFCRKQWEDFNFKLSDGECLSEVQSRNIFALNKVLMTYKDKNIVVGSHGTALSTIINYYDKTFGYSDFNEIRYLMPWIVEFIFEEDECINIQKYNLFEDWHVEQNASIILEQLTHENYHYACEINRDDVPEEWVDTAATIMEINDYGVENHLIGHTFLARIGDKYIGLIMVGEALDWDTDPIEMRGIPFYRLMGFVVDKEYRNKGLGGKIMEKAIEQVYQEFGRRSLALGVHKDNIQAGRFYERHGFKRMGVFEGDDEYYLRLI